MHWRETSVDRVRSVLFDSLENGGEGASKTIFFFSISSLRLQFHKCSLFAISPEVVCFEIRAVRTFPVSGDEILSGEKKEGGMNYREQAH